MTREALDGIAAAERERRRGCTHLVRVCTGAGCMARGAEGIRQAFVDEAATGVGITRAGCMGLCSAGPLVRIEPEGTLYACPSSHEVDEVVSWRLRRGVPVHHLSLESDAAFFAGQQPVVLTSCGRIDPERIEEAIAAGAYGALARAVKDMTPAEVIEQVRASGLRGRGGAGYPTGLKWTTVAKSPSERKYVICNADEGDPGAFMDRTVLEGDPHRVLEGMAIGAYAVGATHGYIYVRGEYPMAIKRLQMAIRQAEALQLPGFSFSVELRIGAGAYVCGEETALIASIEGKRGQPRPRPPYPAESGLWGAPTLLNNVETFASVPAVIARGGSWYAGIGTERSRGTKVFSIAGSVRRTGVVEVPMGISLRGIVDDIAGGPLPGRTIKAVQTGGPGGGCVPASLFDTRVDYESLTGLGSMMGSGGMVVLDDATCMVDLTRYFMRFCMDESCGKCIPCRAGTVQMHDLLVKITRGEATTADLILLEELGDMVRHASLCGLGQNAPNPLLSTLRHFRDEYVSHIVDRTCPAGVCVMQPAPSAGVVP